jgi:hypothetical protein
MTLFWFDHEQLQTYAVYEYGPADDKGWQAGDR